MCPFSTLILLVGFLTCKNRLPYNLYCVDGDVKHCSIHPSIVAIETSTFNYSVDGTFLEVILLDTEVLPVLPGASYHVVSQTSGAWTMCRSVNVNRASSE